MSFTPHTLEVTLSGPGLPPGLLGPACGECRVRILKVLLAATPSRGAGDVTVSAHWWGADDATDPVGRPTTTTTKRGAVVFLFPIHTRQVQMQRYLTDAVEAVGEALHLTVKAGTRMVGTVKVSHASNEMRGSTLPILNEKGAVVGRVHLDLGMSFKPETETSTLPPPPQMPPPNLSSSVSAMSVVPSASSQTIIATAPSAVSSVPPAVAQTLLKTQGPPPPVPQRPPIPNPNPPPEPLNNSQQQQNPKALEDLYTRGLKLREQMSHALLTSSIPVPPPSALSTRPLSSMLPIHPSSVLLPQDQSIGHVDQGPMLSSDSDDDGYQEMADPDSYYPEGHKATPKAKAMHYHHGRWDLKLVVLESIGGQQHPKGLRFTLRLSRDVVTSSQYLSGEFLPHSSAPLELHATVTSFTEASGAILEAWIVGGGLLGVCSVPRCLNPSVGVQSHHLRLRDPITSSEARGSIVIEVSMGREASNRQRKRSPPGQGRYHRDPVPTAQAVTAAPSAPPQMVAAPVPPSGIIIHPDSLVLGKVTRVEVTHTMLDTAPPEQPKKPEPIHIPVSALSYTKPSPNGSAVPLVMAPHLSPVRQPAVSSTVGVAMESTLHQIKEDTRKKVRFHVNVERLLHLPLVACRSDPNNAVPPTAYVVVQKINKSPAHNEPSCSPCLKYALDVSLPCDDEMPMEPIIVDVYHSAFDQWLGRTVVDIRLLACYLQRKQSGGSGHADRLPPVIDGYYHIRTSKATDGSEAHDGSEIIGQMKVSVSGAE